MRTILVSFVLMTTVVPSCTSPGDTHRKFLANVRAGNLRIVTVLLDRGYVHNVNVMDERCNTALMLAAENGHTGLVRLLLRRGGQMCTSKISTVTRRSPSRKLNGTLPLFRY